MVDISRKCFCETQRSCPPGSTTTNTNYSVDAEIIEHTGEVGDIVVYDKMVNGFKVRYGGSAGNAKIKLVVTGGI